MHTPVTLTNTPEIIAQRFSKLGIAATTYAHPPVFTVEEGLDYERHMPGGHTKNLFLKDKKGELCLVTAWQDSTIDLKSLSGRIGMGRFSFGSAALMQQVLGVTPGTVTPLSLMNDADKRIKTFVLDAALMGFDVVNCHPLRNDRTTALTPADLVKFVEDAGYAPVILPFNT